MAPPARKKSESKEPEIKPSGRLYEIVEERVVKASRGKDPLEEALRAEDEELAREAKRLRLQELVLERRKRISELKRSLGEESVLSEGTSEPEISPQLVREIAKLPDEERKKVIQTYAMLKAAGKTSGQTGAFLLPWLIGFARTNPGTSPDVMLKAAEAMAKQFKAGIEVMKAIQPTQQPVQVDIVGLLQTFGQLMSTWRDDLKKAMEELVERVRPQPSVFERILMDEKLYERAKELGMFGHPTKAETPPEVLFEIERLRTARDMAIEKMRDERAKWLAEMEFKREIEREKWEAVKSIFEGKVGTVIERLGEAAADRVSTYGPPSGAMNIACPKCNGTFWVFPGQTKAICPYCGTILRRPEVPRPGASGGGAGGTGPEEPEVGSS